MKILVLIITIFFTVLSPAKMKDESEVRQLAYHVLVQKCNVCHRTENPDKVFTIENMDGFSTKIKRQVFVWKRMPKGNEIKLTDIERQEIKTWINSI